MGGIVKGVTDFVQNTVGEVTGHNKREAKKRENEAIGREESRIQADKDAKIADEKEASDKAEGDRERGRVAGASRSQTLLTGGGGLEDEEANVSRRTLLGS